MADLKESIRQFLDDIAKDELEERVVEYVIREVGNGRKLEDALHDPYVKNRLNDDGSNLVCNWESSPRDACESNAVVSLAKSNVSGTPQSSRHCENGQWLVTVTSR